MRKKHCFLTFAILCSIIASIIYYTKYDDRLSDDFFRKILGNNQADTKLVCIHNNISLTGYGLVTEKHLVSHEIIDSFENSFIIDSTTLGNKSYLMRYASNGGWHKTPLKKDDTSKIDTSGLFINNTCTSADIFNRISCERGNYYWISSSSQYYFTIILVCPKEKSIYVLEKNM